MELNNRRKNCTMSISQEVIEKIAKLVISEIDSVSSLTQSPNDIRRFLFFKAKPKSIIVSTDNDSMQVDMYINIKKGSKIKEVSEKVQELVKEQIQNMTNILVSKVNVHICGVN